VELAWAGNLVNEPQVSARKNNFCGCWFFAEVTDDLVMNFGSERMQAHGQGFVWLVGNQIDFGAEELANE
jgi:hypothetical protein